jgi:hypothetical protein
MMMVLTPWGTDIYSRLRLPSIAIGSNWGSFEPIRQLHLSQNIGSEMILETANAQANWRKWNFYTGGYGASTPTDLYLRILNDAGDATTIDCLKFTGSNGQMTTYKNLNIGTQGQVATPTPTAIVFDNSFSDGYTVDKCKIFLHGSRAFGIGVGPASDVQFHSNGTHDFYIANAKIMTVNNTGVTFHYGGGLTFRTATVNLSGAAVANWLVIYVGGVQRYIPLYYGSNSGLATQDTHY